MPRAFICFDIRPAKAEKPRVRREMEKSDRSCNLGDLLEETPLLPCLGAVCAFIGALAWSFFQVGATTELPF